MPTARPYAPEDRDRWDDFVRRSRAPHFLFERGYMEYHADRFTDASLVLEDGGRIVALLPASRAGGEVVSHGWLTFGGFVSDRRMTANGMLAALEAAVGHLRETGVARLVYKPVPHIYHRVAAEEDLYALFRAGGRLVGRDLSSSILLAERLPYSKGRRADVKRARAGGLEVGDDEDLAGFVALLAGVLQERHDATPTHTAQELELLAGRFPERIRLVTARRDGELLAGAVMYETPVVAHAQYLASGEAGREAGALDVVVDTLLDEYAAAGVRWFDFGISNDRQGALNAGLVRNKESFGARATTYDRYVLDL